MNATEGSRAVIEVREVRKVYPNGHEALKDITFTVPDGQMVAIIGRSGAGKSTLLRCLNGLLPVTSGNPSWLMTVPLPPVPIRATP